MKQRYFHTFAQFCGPKNSLSPAGNLEFCPSCPDFPLPDEPDEPEEQIFINIFEEYQIELIIHQGPRKDFKNVGADFHNHSKKLKLKGTFVQKLRLQNYIFSKSVFLKIFWYCCTHTNEANVTFFFALAYNIFRSRKPYQIGSKKYLTELMNRGPHPMNQRLGNVSLALNCVELQASRLRHAR